MRKVFAPPEAVRIRRHRLLLVYSLPTGQMPDVPAICA